MAFSDWDFFITHSDFIVGVGTGILEFPSLAAGGFTPPTPIDTGLLRTDGQGINQPSFHAVPKFPSFLATDRGILKGKIRTIVYNHPTVGIKSFGLCCMQNVLDMINASGNCYVLVFDDLGDNQDIQLGKVTGNDLKTFSTLIASAPDVWLEDTAIAVELEWDATSGTEVQLCARLGTALDFSNLALLLTFTDTTFPHLTTVAEGFFGAAGSANYNGSWDQFKLFQLP